MSKMKKVPGFENYSVSSDGRVFSNKRSGQIELSPSTSTGYAQVKFSNGTEKKNWQVHRLVAEMFIPNRKNLEIVNHIDGDKLNNDVSNLEWVTRKGNAKHYEEKLAGKYRSDRKAKKDNDMKARLSIINHAHSACTSNPELFHSIYKTVMAEV
jgi:hypothetical protein